MFDSNKTIHVFYHRQVPTCSTDSWADPRGSEGCWGCVSPLSVQFLSFSYSLGTVYKIIGRPTRLGLAPPHLGNPESAIDFRGGSSISQSGLPDIFGLSPYNPHEKKKLCSPQPLPRNPPIHITLPSCLTFLALDISSAKRQGGGKLTIWLIFLKIRMKMKK